MPVSLIDADIVITDYSSIVYEAYLLGKLVGFYIPDIQYYRLSPGLNADPLELCPGLVADTPEQLAAMLASWAAEPSAYPHQQLQRSWETRLQIAPRIRPASWRHSPFSARREARSVRSKAAPIRCCGIDVEEGA